MAYEISSKEELSEKELKHDICKRCCKEYYHKEHEYQMDQVRLDGVFHGQMSGPEEEGGRYCRGRCQSRHTGCKGNDDSKSDQIVAGSTENCHANTEEESFCNCIGQEVGHCHGEYNQYNDSHRRIHVSEERLQDVS